MHMQLASIFFCLNWDYLTYIYSVFFIAWMVSFAQAKASSFKLKGQNRSKAYHSLNLAVDLSKHSLAYIGKKGSASSIIVILKHSFVRFQFHCLFKAIFFIDAFECRTGHWTRFSLTSLSKSNYDLTAPVRAFLRTSVRESERAASTTIAYFILKFFELSYN